MSSDVSVFRRNYIKLTSYYLSVEYLNIATQKYSIEVYGSVHEACLPNYKFKTVLRRISRELFYPSGACVAFVTMIFSWTTYRLATGKL